MVGLGRTSREVSGACELTRGREQEERTREASTARAEDECVKRPL